VDLNDFGGRLCELIWLTAGTRAFVNTGMKNGWSVQCREFPDWNFFFFFRTVLHEASSCNYFVSSVLSSTEKLSYTAPRLVLPTVCFTSHHSQTTHDSAPCTVQTTDHEMIPARGWAWLARCGGTAGYKGDYWSRIGRSETVLPRHTLNISTGSIMSWASALRDCSEWVTETRHSPRNFAHAHLSLYWQELSPGLWTTTGQPNDAK